MIEPRKSYLLWSDQNNSYLRWSEIYRLLTAEETISLEELKTIFLAQAINISSIYLPINSTELLSPLIEQFVNSLYHHRFDDSIYTFEISEESKTNPSFIDIYDSLIITHTIPLALKVINEKVKKLLKQKIYKER